MKTATKTKMITLISAILIIVVAISFFVPYTIAYFAKKDKSGGDASTPNISCEMIGNGFKTNPFTLNNTQMYVATSSFNGSTDSNGTSASVISKSNIPTFVRVKLTFKLAPANTGITQNELTSLNNNFAASVNSNNWILATNDNDGSGSTKQINTSGDTNAAYLTTYYLYYTGVVPASESNTEILVFDQFKQIDSTYNGNFLVAELFCEAISATTKSAQEWMSVALSDLTGWEKTWYDGVKGFIN